MNNFMNNEDGNPLTFKDLFEITKLTADERREWSSYQNIIVNICPFLYHPVTSLKVFKITNKIEDIKLKVSALDPYGRYVIPFTSEGKVDLKFNDVIHATLHYMYGNIVGITEKDLIKESATPEEYLNSLCLHVNNDMSQLQKNSQTNHSSDHVLSDTYILPITPNLYVPGVYSYPKNMSVQYYCESLVKDHQSWAENDPDKLALDLMNANQYTYRCEYSELCNSELSEMLDKIDPSSNQSFNERSSDQAKIASDIMDSLDRSKNTGNLPAGMIRWANELVHPKQDWREILSDYIRNRIVARKSSDGQDSYRRSKRRTVNKNFILPTKYTPIISVAVGVDTSGSMSKEDLNEALSETAGILEVNMIKNIQFFAIDTRMTEPVISNNVNDLSLNGGGGTDMTVGFDYIRQLDISSKPTFFILFTDGYTPWPEEPVDVVECIVVITSSSNREQVNPPEWCKTLFMCEAE